MQLANECLSQNHFTTYRVTNSAWVFALLVISIQTFPCECPGKIEVNTCTFPNHTLLPLQENALSMEDRASVSTIQLPLPTAEALPRSCRDSADVTT